MLEKIANKNSYRRFKTIFNKGEQICIVGKGWDSYGYITKIEEDGITLTGLKNQKEYKYSWNCFEVVYHAGYKVKKSTETEVSNIFDISFKISIPPLSTTVIDKGKTNIQYEKLNPKKNTFYLRSYLNFKTGEILPMAKYWEGFMDDKYIAVDFQVNGYKSSHGSINDKVGWIKANEKCGYLYPSNYARKIELCNQGYYEGDDCGEITFNKGKNTQVVANNKNLVALRYVGKTGRKKTYYSVGDPVIFEGELIDYKIWKGDQGFLMSNFYADIRFNEEKYSARK